MCQQPIELILLRQVAGQLATPMFLVDHAGKLLYYNEAAAAVLGRRYDEDGGMALEEWSTVFAATDSLGRLLPADELPLVVALFERAPCHGTFWIRGADGVSRHLAVTAVPVDGQGGVPLGGLAVFWVLPPR